MKVEEIARWRDNLNFVSSVLEELCNYASDDEIRALRKLDVVIDGLYNLEQKLKRENN